MNRKPIDILDAKERSKKWICDIFDPSQIRVASVGANGTAKSTYTFKLLFLLCVQGNWTILITSGTLDQAKKLFEQKLKPLLQIIGFRKQDNNRMEFVLHTNVEIHIKSRENYETTEGIEYDAWFADEFQDHTKASAEMFHKRTRKRREKSIIRIAGLSDEPNHWQYEYFENNDFTFNELALTDHPDPKWIEYYGPVLDSLFKGAALQRYKFGLKTSLSGTGLFYLTTDHIQTTPINPTEDIHLVWDFNVEYRAVSAWQQTGKVDKGYPTINCVKSWQMKEATVAIDAERLCAELESHKALIYLDGDASGDNRSAQATGSMWKSIDEVFRAAFPGRIRYVVKKSNPSVKDTIQCANWALNSNLITISEPAKKLYNSVVAAKADKHGEPDKASDYKDGGARSHEMDTFRYAVWYFYGKYYTKKSFFIV